MIAYHLCKVTTLDETVLDGNDKKELREELKMKAAPFTVEHSYQELLQGNAHVEFTCSQLPFQMTMKRSVLGLYLIMVKLGQAYYRFVIDTGAQISSIRSDIAERHHLKKLPGSISIHSIGGKEQRMAGYLLTKLQIGALVIRSLPVIALKTSALPFSLPLFDGILGWDILSQLDFELDDAEHLFKVISNRYRFPYPNMVKAMFPIFLMKDGKGNLLKMGFDSGARLSWMNKEAMEKYAYPLSKESGMIGFGVHGLEEMNVQLVSDMELYLYKAKINLKHVHTGRTDVLPHIVLDGIVGNEIFRNRRIRIINSKEMVLIA